MTASDKQNSRALMVNIEHLALLILLVGLLLFRPLMPSALADSIFLTAVILSGWLAGGRSRWSTLLMAVFSLVALAVLTVDIFAHQQTHQMVHDPVGFLAVVAAIAMLLYSAAVILHSLLTAERISLDEIVGTLNIYLIMGYTWSYVYVLVELCSPGSFGPAGYEGSLGLRFIYLSFITLTTVGFGDTVPLSPQAQILVIFQAIMGQFYVAIVVAYLVSMYVTHNLAPKETKE
jgi:voltage-gated potassium channel